MKHAPSNPADLRLAIIERIVLQGKTCDLNDLDISGVSDFSQLFKNLDFNGDISRWNVAHVTNMHEMFSRSSFNGDLSQWDVSSVVDMSYMFERSKFDQRIASWNVARVRTMEGMFLHAVFNQSLAPWDVHEVENFTRMFYEAPYNQSLADWRPSGAKTMEAMFWQSAYNGDLSSWTVPSDCNTDYLINFTRVTSDAPPSFYHFRLMYTYCTSCGCAGLDFVEQHRSMLDGVGATSMEAALWLHRQWYEGPKKVETLDIGLDMLLDSFKR